MKEVHCPDCTRVTEVVWIARISDQKVLYQCEACKRVFEKEDPAGRDLVD